MSFFDNAMLKLDETLSSVLGDWDIYTTTLAAGLICFFAYQVFTRRDPDTHPMLLASQGRPSQIRYEGESPVYRSHASPHGMELNSGLNVRDPGLSKWMRGRDGDLRDVWRKIAGGVTDAEGNPTGVKGKFFTVLGSEKIVEHEIDQITRQISIIGQHIKQQGGTRVAIYLPNSIDFLASFFCCTFYGLTPIILPYDQEPATIISMLKRSQADTMVTAVGSIPFDAIVKEYPKLRHLIWVVDEGSKHLDWDEVPKGTGGSVNVSTWQEIVEDQASTTVHLPELSTQEKPKSVIAFWLSTANSEGSLVEYTHTNLIAAISAQITALPAAQRVTPADLFLPADSLSTIYTLVVTLSAIYNNASLALNSVAGRVTDLRVATRGVAPTIIVAPATSLSNTHKETTSRLSTPLLRLVHWLQTRSLTQDGVMPLASALTRFNDAFRPSIGTPPGKLRLLYTSDQAGGDLPRLSSMDLSDLRIFMNSRVIYALTAEKVAGAVCQTAFYDYRVDAEIGEKAAHFGPPVSSVEVLVRDVGEHKNTDELAVGEIVVRGPAVVDGEAALGIVGTFKDDNTLAYI